MFFAVCYGKEGSQIITGGTDRKIGYWETYDGAQIRELDGSKSASINGMDVYNDQFITGSGDKLIKVKKSIQSSNQFIILSLATYTLCLSPQRCGSMIKVM